MEIAVADPVATGSGMSKHMEYKVATKLTAPQAAFKFTEFDVMRRYSDFEWFYNLLLGEFPGAIVPTLPEKAAVGNFGASFVEERRRGLENFIARVSLHPELSTSEHFVTFLESGYLAPAKKEATEKSRRGSGGGGGGWFASKAKVALNKPKEMEVTGYDTQLESAATYVGQLEVGLKALCGANTTLLKKREALVDSLGEVSAALGGLGESEGDVALAAVLAAASVTAAESGALSTGLSDSIAAKFARPTEDYHRLCGAVKQSLAKRAEKRLAVGYALCDLDNKIAFQEKLDATGATTAKGEAKIKAAGEATETSREELKKAQDDFEATTQRTTADYARFVTDKAAGTRGMVRALVEAQVEAHAAMAAKWEELLASVPAAPEAEDLQAEKEE